jgi:hypothetical protein
MASTLVEKWRVTGLLENLYPEEKQEQLAVILEDMYNYMIENQDILTARQKAIFIPLVTRIYRFGNISQISIPILIKSLKTAENGMGIVDLDGTSNQIDLESDCCANAYNYYLESITQ